MMGKSLFLCTLEHVLKMNHHSVRAFFFRRSTKLSMTSLHTDHVQISIRVYPGKSRTTTDLKEAIREEMRAIHRSVCKDVMDNFVRRLKKCTELNGGHLAHTL